MAMASGAASSGRSARDSIDRGDTKDKGGAPDGGRDGGERKTKKGLTEQERADKIFDGGGSAPPTPGQEAPGTPPVEAGTEGSTGLGADPNAPTRRRTIVISDEDFDTAVTTGKSLLGQ